MRLVAQFMLLLVASVASAQDRRVFYFDGDAFEQITAHGVTVTARLNQNHGENWLTVYVVNDSDEPLNLIPTNIALHQSLPVNKDLALKTEKQLARGVDRRVFWGQVLAGVGAGLSRNYSSVTTSTPYGSVSTLVNTPDYEGQARWLAWADAIAARGQDIKGVAHHDSLRATTLFPGSRFAGRLCFNRDKELSAALAQNGPGSEVIIGYIFKSNLGWMPGSSSVVLRNK